MRREFSYLYPFDVIREVLLNALFPEGHILNGLPHETLEPQIMVACIRTFH